MNGRSTYYGRFGSHKGGGTTGGFKDATDIEDAAHGVNQINRRIKWEKHINSTEAREERERAKVTLSPILNDWLAKEVP